MRVAITGAAGQLGSELVRAFGAAGASVQPLTRPQFDLDDPGRVTFDADVVVNAAAWTDLDGCARDPARAMARNGTAVGTLVAAAQRAGARFVQVSTNEVFDGAEQRSYAEDDVPNPINPYGASKLVGERAVASGLIVRTAWIFGGPRSFPIRIRAAAERAAAAGTPLRVVADEIGNPTPAAALAQRIVTLVLAIDSPPPIVHLAGEPPTSRHAWASRLLSAAGLPEPEPIAQRDYVRDSTPPPHAVLDTSLSRALGLPAIHWEDSSP